MKYFLALLLLLFSVAASATTFTAASCSAANFQTQINSATDGDTVQGPSAGGSATWTTAVTVSKGITLTGTNGANKCTISFGTGGSFTGTADTVASLFVTGFAFQNGFTNGGCPISFNATKSPLTKPFEFHLNTYSDTTGGSPTTELCLNGPGAGLVDNNTFTVTAGADEIIHIFGDNGSWTDDLTPGSATMFYIETNTFTNNNGTFQCAAEEAFEGAEFVFRHNSLSFCDNDMHDGSNGGRWGEWYENTYSVQNGTQIRGGSGLYYSNHTNGTISSPGVSVGPDCPSSDTCSGTYPVALQVGRGYSQTTYSPLYLWGNDTAIQSGIGASGGQSLVVVGGSLNGCTGGHPGNVCDAIATASLPTLTKCQTAADVSAGCPVTYTYTALTYPYPMGSTQVATPTFSPVAGTYTSVQNVTISTATGGATICYTTDGSTPTANGAGTCTHGTTYSSAVSVGISETLKAVGSLSGDTDSAVGSAAYTINLVVVAPAATIFARK